MDSRNQVGLEFVEIDVEVTIETQGRGNRRHDLGDQAIEVGEAGRNDTEFLLAEVVDGFVIDLATMSQILDYSRHEAILP